MANANSTADRAIEILLLFRNDRTVLPAASIAEHFKMSRSTTYRYLSGLRAHGLLVERPEGFGLGYRIFDLAAVARRTYGILDVAEDKLGALSRRLGETILLTQRVDETAVILKSWESTQPLRISYEQSRGLPFPVGASSKVLLAFASPRERERSLALLSGSLEPSAIGQLVRQLAEVRARGYAVNRGEIDDGVAAIAVPVLSGGEGLQYSISVVAPMTRLDVKHAGPTVEALKEVASEISLAWSRIQGKERV